MGAWDLEESGGTGSGVSKITSTLLSVTSPTGPTTDIELPAYGPGAGTYGSGQANTLVIQVDAEGRIVAASSPTIQIPEGQVTGLTTSLTALALQISNFGLFTITSDPNPAVQSQYYRLNYSGNFTLPTTGITAGNWIIYKFIASSGTITIVGTIDGVVNPTVSTRYQAGYLIYNGTTWDNI